MLATKGLQHQALLLGLLLLLPLLLPSRAEAQWRPDILEGYSCLTIDQGRDYSGPVTATLVRRDTLLEAPRALLYVHGYNDYFFQSALGDSITRHSYAFYALDLRKYGRSLSSGQDPFEVRHLREYYADLAKAIQQIKAGGARELVLMAHSTGGLIISLYLEDTQNSDSVQALVLNSPFLDFNFSKVQERLVIPMLDGIGRVSPRTIVAGISKEPDLYAQSLLKRYHGLWDYNTEWKKAKGHTIRLEWLRAIRRGHQQVQRGLSLRMPILLMSSDSSIRARGAWQPAYGRADLVLDVDDIQHYGLMLGDKVQPVRIVGGLHDLFLSSDSAAYAEAYRQLFRFLDQLPPQH